MTTTTHTPEPSYLDRTADLLTRWDASRARSMQTDLGVSELGGCRSAIGFKLAGVWESNTTDPWRAIVGTAMHDWLTERRREAFPHLLHDVHVDYRGTGGHPDEVDPKADEVAEWKFPRLSTSNLWRNDPEAFAPKRLQAHTYAAGLVDAGILTESCTVVVAVMPVDGTFADWWTHVEPFDRAIADQAADRRAEVEHLQAAGERLPKDKPYTWCEQFCEFFTLCRGASKPPDSEPITDPELAAAVRLYGETLDALRPLEKQKKELAGIVRGLVGVVGDPESGDAWRVSMTSPAGTKTVTDVDTLVAEYTEHGWTVPTKTVPTSSPSLRVAKIKAKGTK